MNLADKSISEVKAILSNLKSDEYANWIYELSSDTRASVQKMAKQLEKKHQAHLKEIEKNESMFIYEKQANHHGFIHVAGIDEAGRGPLVSSVVAAAVILNPEIDWTGIDDSKKLSEEKRNFFYDKIVNHAQIGRAHV